MVRAIQNQTMQTVYDYVCEQLRAEPPHAKSNHPQIAEILARLVSPARSGSSTNATGPKVVRALCRVLNS